MTLAHVQQPAGSKFCGQACVATVAGTELQAVIDLIGKAPRAGTTENDLRPALAALGWTLGQFSQGGVQVRSGVVLCRWRERARKHGYHWIVINLDTLEVHDPEFALPMSIDDWRAFTNASHATVTSSASVWRSA